MNLFEEYEQIKELRKLIGKRFKWFGEPVPFTITQIDVDCSIRFRYDDEIFVRLISYDHFKEDAIEL